MQYFIILFFIGFLNQAFAVEYYRFKEARGFLFQDEDYRNVANYTDDQSVFQLFEKTPNRIALNTKLFYVKPEAIRQFDAGLASWRIQAIERHENVIHFHFFSLANEKMTGTAVPWKPLTVPQYESAKGQLSLLIKPVKTSIDMSIKAAPLKEKEITWDIDARSTDELTVNIPLKRMLGFTTEWTSSETLSLRYKTKFNNIPVVVIDPGHGNGDGTCVKNLCEEDIVLKFSMSLKGQIEKAFGNSVRVILTRNGGPQKITLQDRVLIGETEKADLLISVHIDSVSTADGARIKPPEGLACFFKNSFSLELAETLCSKYSSGYPTTYVVQRNLHVLHSSQFPSVLIELGNLQKEADRAFFSNRKKSDALSAEMAKKIREYIVRNQ